NEIAVCRDLLAEVPALSNKRVPITETKAPFDPFAFDRRLTPEIELAGSVQCGGEQTVRVVVTQKTWDKVAPKIRAKDDVRPEAIYEDLNIMEVDPASEF